MVADSRTSLSTLLPFLAVAAFPLTGAMARRSQRGEEGLGPPSPYADRGSSRLCTLNSHECPGYPCEPYNNPADFFLDVISGDSSAVGLNREEEDCEANETEQLSQREESVIETLVECYANSSFCRDTKAELDELSGGQKKRSSAFKEITYDTSCHQLKGIIRRLFKYLLGNPWASIAQDGSIVYNLDATESPEELCYDTCLALLSYYSSICKATSMKNSPGLDFAISKVFHL
ncbi:ATP-binding cassette sub-family G member 2 [Sciurus carolinensis]|uniref:ATP-binding cassette sub-family G member 2 n=1 Tax=Sciurus carolinensis TaxID=30640 RepID=A0AA41T9G7_SCICA|nr:ATP-binding cassette sub-family G member 2 [Sciurus carolinensis]